MIVFLTSLCEMEVYNAVTSKEIIIWWSGMVVLFMILAKDLESWIVKGWGSYRMLYRRNVAKLCMGDEVPIAIDEWTLWCVILMQFWEECNLRESIYV